MMEDWVECSFGDVLDIQGGSQPPKKEFIYDPKEGYIRLLQIRDFGNKPIPTFIPLEKARKRCTSDDIFIARYGASLGRIVTGMEGAYNVALAKVIDRYSVFSKRYLFFLLQTQIFQQPIHMISRSAQNGFAKSDVYPIQLPLPPLPIQRAIVARIEELFSSLDKGIADLQRAQAQLQVYRQAVLKKAFEGISEFELLGEIGEWKGGGTPSKRVKEYWENGNIPWVSSRDVKQKEIHDTERHITEMAIPNSSTKWIEKEALLFVMRSGILRRIFPISIARVRLCVNQDIQTLKLNENYSSEYVYWYLTGNEGDIRHNCSKDGTTVESIDASKLKKYRVPFCDKETQKQVIKEIESRLSVCDQVKANLKESLAKAEALRQSILKKAFDGKLLAPEEIEACRRETDYEPAEVLLARIRNGQKI